MGADSGLSNISKAGIGGAALAAVMLIALPLTSGQEGLKLTPYRDPANILTICYGETDGVLAGQIKTKAQCDAMLDARLAGFSVAVANMVNFAMKPPMQAAFTDFSYNVGLEKFKASTALKKLNAGDLAGACQELLRWTRARGRVLPGLERRRAAEYKLCMEGI